MNTPKPLNIKEMQLLTPGEKVVLYDDRCEDVIEILNNYSNEESIELEIKYIKRIDFEYVGIDWNISPNTILTIGKSIKHDIEYMTWKIYKLAEVEKFIAVYNEEVEEYNNKKFNKIIANR